LLRRTNVDNILIKLISYNRLYVVVMLLMIKISLRGESVQPVFIMYHGVSPKGWRDDRAHGVKPLKPLAQKKHVKKSRNAKRRPLLRKLFMVNPCTELRSWHDVIY